jgi:hypothetical protein
LTRSPKSPSPIRIEQIVRAALRGGMAVNKIVLEGSRVTLYSTTSHEDEHGTELERWRKEKGY